VDSVELLGRRALVYQITKEGRKRQSLRVSESASESVIARQRRSEFLQFADGVSLRPDAEIFPFRRKRGPPPLIDRRLPKA
jgi:hypothetical protein